MQYVSRVGSGQCNDRNKNETEETSMHLFGGVNIWMRIRTVEWPRYKERDARFAAGLEDSFSSFG